MVQLYCGLPGSSGGGTVYSYDGNGADGTMIANQLTQPRKSDRPAAPVGMDCIQAVNTLTGSAKGCPTGMVWIPVFQPYGLTIPTSGYSVNTFTLMFMSPQAYVRSSQVPGPSTP